MAAALAELRLGTALAELRSGAEADPPPEWMFRRSSNSCATTRAAMGARAAPEDLQLVDSRFGRPVGDAAGAPGVLTWAAVEKELAALVYGAASQRGNEEWSNQGCTQ